MTQAPPPPDKGTVRSRRPRSRCHVCGSPEVRAVCCGCHRLLCRKHDDVDNPVDFGWLMRWMRSRREPPLSHVEPGTDAPVHAEFRAAVAPNPNQNRTPRTDRLSKRHFCRDCMPVGRPYDAEMAAAGITLGLGVLTFFSNFIAGGVLTSVGGLRIVRRLLMAHRQRSADRGKPPRLHLDPRIRKLKVVETICATAHLNGPDSYRSAITGVRGRIRMEAAWGRTHWAQLSDHRRRYHIPKDEELSFWAGSLVVRGAADLVLSPVSLKPVDPDSVDPDSVVPDSVNAGSIESSTVVVLRSSAAEHAVLRPPGPQGDPRRVVEVDYKITEPEDGWTVPVWLTPTIVPESNRHALELEIQWRACGSDDDSLKIKNLELLRISVPAGWGNLEDFTGAERVTISAPGDGRRYIEWKKPPVEPESRAAAVWLFSSTGRSMSKTRSMPQAT